MRYCIAILVFLCNGAKCLAMSGIVANGFEHAFVIANIMAQSDVMQGGDTAEAIGLVLYAVCGLCLLVAGIIFIVWLDNRDPKPVRSSAPVLSNHQSMAPEPVEALADVVSSALLNSSRESSSTMRLLNNWLFWWCVCAVGLSIATVTPLGARHWHSTPYDGGGDPIEYLTYGHSGFMLIALGFVFLGTVALTVVLYSRRLLPLALLVGASSIIVWPFTAWPQLSDEVLLLIRLLHVVILSIATCIVARLVWVGFASRQTHPPRVE